MGTGRGSVGFTDEKNAIKMMSMAMVFNPMGEGKKRKTTTPSPPGELVTGKTEEW